ncbi:hypothetical protein BN946_scf184800.g1 [Trametes cinnabarina]|uniref:Uncharacterized protein n=1 Tax=Pycnoporus cinnabarinus TaxID=5643 RepID=A0A060SIL7_PYCCI|nr:hypothetical protein BN946_scf184800.g1 [Trametes cinnabarina]
MAGHARKRKQRPTERRNPESSALLDATLRIHAHEADLVRGPQAAAAARSLEVIRREEHGKVVLEIGDGLIKWEGEVVQSGEDAFGEDRLQLGVGTKGTTDAKKNVSEGIWVDRYDARLLLDALPEIHSESVVSTDPSSPSGWSDLPSDAEDTFFLSAEEVEDYRREKRRRIIHEDREARLRALRAESEREPGDSREEWGGSDEEPDDIQLELMRRTASHVLSSPNPSQLEMRILANHGADPRFAFLRGRWSRTWRLTKTKARLELDAKNPASKEKGPSSPAAAGPAGIVSLAGYGDSDEEEEDDGTGEVSQPNVTDQAQHDIKVADGTASAASEDALKAARRARAREWAEKRRAAEGGSGGDEDIVGS